MFSRTGAIPVFFSSDYVFRPEAKSYQEQDLRAPETSYGSQKLAVEQYLEQNFENFLIFRTSKLMSKFAQPKNILLPVIRDLAASKPVRCFQDQRLNPVFVEDIAEVLKVAFDRRLRGIYHLGTRRVFTRFELAKFLAVALGYNADLVQSLRMSEVDFSEPRPTHNTLNCDKIETALGFRFTEIEEALPDLRRWVL